MTKIDHSRAYELFLDLVDLPRLERDRALDERCDGDARLRGEVEALLSSDDAAPDSFLGGLGSGALDLRAGMTVAGYEIVRLLGEGGMGAVYEARQSSPARRVALKVIRSDRMSAEARRRQRQEAEVLGALQHPGIAQIHEAGTAKVALGNGRTVELPFLAMELVRGVPMLDFANATSLPVRERLELVARTCDAVHHAHQRGFIHRDLKSDNVLVGTPPDSSSPEPKILDFGIARMVGDEERSSLTRIGQIVGTLGAMSPEQISGLGGLDVRTDVYALGALLYELLAGHPPIEITDCTFPEAVRRVSNETPASLESVSPELRGDLSVIASTALHKDKERRYQSAAALAEDLRRHLTGEPVRARADSTWYVVGRTLRRHRVAAASAALLLLLGLAFVIVTRVQSDRNRRLAVSETAARERAEQQLTVSNIERGRMFGRTHNGLGADLIWSEYLTDPGSQHAFWALWEFYSHNPCVSTTAAHADRVRQVEVSPDGEWFATGDFAGWIVLWDRSGREIGRLASPGATVRAMSPAPNGRSLAASYLDGTVAVWDVSTMSRLWSVQAFEPNSRKQSAGGRSLAHHPSGEWLATGGFAGDVHVLDATTGTEVRRLPHADAVWSIAFSEDGARMVSTGSPDVKVWDVPSFEVLASIAGHTTNTIASALTRDGSRLFTGGGDKRLIEWDVADERVVRTVRPGNGWVRRLTWNSTGDALFVNGLYRADLMPLDGLEVASSVPFFSNATAGFAVFPEDDLVVTTDDDGAMRMWETNAHAGRADFGGHTSGVRSAISPDGASLVTCDDSGTLRLWRTTSDEPARTIAEGIGSVRSLQFNPRQPQVGALGPSGILRIVDTRTGDELRSFESCMGRANRSFAFSPDGERVVAAGEDGVYRVRRIDDGTEELAITVAPFHAISVCFSPDGQRLATVSRREPTGPTEPWSHRLDVWSIDGEHLASEASGPPWWSASFSPDGSQVVCGTWDWRIGLWDWDGGGTRLLEGHEGTVWDARYLPEQPGLVVSSSADGTVRLWSLELSRDVLTLKAFEHADVVSLGSSADGTFIAAAGEGDEALVWDLRHFERHIAGNLRTQLESQLEREGTELIGDGARAELEAWASDVLRRPWPRLNR